MADLPQYQQVIVIRHEWVIGDGESPLLARQLRDGIFFAEKEMEERGFDTKYDDAYYVRTTEDNQVVLYKEETKLT
jgi:hypothetical protein